MVVVAVRTNERIVPVEVRRTGRLSRSGLDLVGDFAFGPGGNAGRFRFPANSSARLDSGRRLVGPDAVAKAAAVADQRDIGVVTKFTVTLRAGIGTSLLTLVRLLSGLKTLRDFQPFQAGAEPLSIDYWRSVGFDHDPDRVLVFRQICGHCLGIKARDEDPEFDLAHWKIREGRFTQFHMLRLLHVRLTSVLVPLQFDRRARRKWVYTLRRQLDVQSDLLFFAVDGIVGLTWLILGNRDRNCQLQ